MSKIKYIHCKIIDGLLFPIYRQALEIFAFNYELQTPNCKLKTSLSCLDKEVFHIQIIRIVCVRANRKVKISSRSSSLVHMR